MKKFLLIVMFTNGVATGQGVFPLVPHMFNGVIYDRRAIKHRDKTQTVNEELLQSYLQSWPLADRPSFQIYGILSKKFPKEVFACLNVCS